MALAGHKLIGHSKKRPQRTRHSLFEAPLNSDGLVSLPRNELDFATVHEGGGFGPVFFGGSNEKMDMDTHCAVVMQHLTVL